MESYLIERGINSTKAQKIVSEIIKQGGQIMKSNSNFADEVDEILKSMPKSEKADDENDEDFFEDDDSMDDDSTSEEMEKGCKNPWMMTVKM